MRHVAGVRPLVVGALTVSLSLACATAVATVAQAADGGPSVVATANPAGYSTKFLQRRLTYAAMSPGPIDGIVGPKTRAAVVRFQTKFGLPVTGVLDEATVPRLVALTGHGYGVKPACKRRAKAICVDTTLKTVKAYEKGRLLWVLDARFGAPATATREGDFSVGRKGDDYDHNGKVTLAEAERYVTRDGGVSMPLPLFFSRGQAVHYSPTFATDGYSGGSNGCANVRDYEKMKALWQWARIYTPVYVYASANL